MNDKCSEIASKLADKEFVQLKVYFYIIVLLMCSFYRLF